MHSIGVPTPDHLISYLLVRFSPPALHRTAQDQEIFPPLMHAAPADPGGPTRGTPACPMHRHPCPPPRQCAATSRGHARAPSYRCPPLNPRCRSRPHADAARSITHARTHERIGRAGRSAGSASSPTSPYRSHRRPATNEPIVPCLMPPSGLGLDMIVQATLEIRAARLAYFQISSHHTPH